jgi:RNA polymerase sigma-70 factor (ECF subfamily)
MNETTFHDLMARIRGGDETAACALFVACHDPLRELVESRMDRVFQKGRVDPEDVIQEAYAAAWSGLGDAEFANFAAFIGWMRKITQNKLIDLRRSLLAEKQDVNLRLSRERLHSASYYDLFDQVASPQTAPSGNAMREEALAALSSQMWRLPEDYRLVIRWRFIQFLPVSEIAARLNRSESAGHQLCHRGLKQLRQLMGSSSDDLKSR